MSRRTAQKNKRNRKCRSLNGLSRKATGTDEMAKDDAMLDGGGMAQIRGIAVRS